MNLQIKSIMLEFSCVCVMPNGEQVHAGVIRHFISPATRLNGFRIDIVGQAMAMYRLSDFFFTQEFIGWNESNRNPSIYGCDGQDLWRQTCEKLGVNFTRAIPYYHEDQLVGLVSD